LRATISSVSLLDVFLLAFLAGAVTIGYRRGAMLQVCSYAGLALGLVSGALAAPRVASLAGADPTRAGLALGTLFVGGAIGDGLGWLLGSTLRSRTRETRLRRADAVGGSLVSAAAMLLATWFIALNLVNGPFPEVAREIQDSAVVRGIAAVLPAPPSLIGEVRQVLNQLGFPDVFLGLPPRPAAPVPLPSGAVAARAAAAAEPGTVQILGSGCGGVLEGSGFVASAGLVVTNAHVIAGIDDPMVRSGEHQYPAVPVLFDSRLDLAVLRVDGLATSPLELDPDVAARGDAGAVVGFPGGGPLRARRAAVRRALEAVGRDIYGDGEVLREVYELQTRVRPGNSGGPFVLPDGEIAGMVFAASTTDDHLGYAIASTEILPLVRRAIDRTRPVGTGTCVP
jgi:S1-C subfamily serine protease